MSTSGDNTLDYGQRKSTERMMKLIIARTGKGEN